MIRLTKKLLFAIEAVLDIAYNGSAAPVRSAEITEREGIPRRYLEPVLQELVREKILIGIRGPSGGYRLARERRRISLGYRLLGEMARGGMGIVYLAAAQGPAGFSKLVALKELRPGLVEDEEFLTMFLEEARLEI